jgi:hypothetical protein
MSEPTDRPTDTGGAVLPELFVDAFDRADRELLASGYGSVSISTAQFREWLRRRRWPFVDPYDDRPTPLADLDHTAERIIAGSARLVGLISGTAGMGGAATIPSEWVAVNIASLRMAQRLCVVYGFDPADDAGQMALCRVLAVTYGVELPMSGPMQLRITDLPGVLLAGARLDEVPAKLLRAMAQSSAWWVAGRLSRLVPVIAAGTHALEARQAVQEAGRTMQTVLRRLAEAPEQRETEIEEALEIRSMDRAAPETPRRSPST